MTTIVLSSKPKQRELSPDELKDHNVEDAEFIGVSFKKSGRIWINRNQQLFQPGVHNFQPLDLVDFGSVATAIREIEKQKEVVLHRMALRSGQYFPRIARPSDQHPLDMPSSPPSDSIDEQEAFTAFRFFHQLIRDLELVMETVEPVAANLDCYGNRIRSLLILVCTECENQMRGVLRENGIEKERYNTKDFFKLFGPMRLSEYAVSFDKLPWLGSFAPFRGWCERQPTHSLPWYDAYNAAKHERARYSEKANLRMVFDSISALWILFLAQYGTGMLSAGQFRNSDIECTEAPRWRYSEVYVYPYQGTECEFEPVKLFR